MICQERNDIGCGDNAGITLALSIAYIGVDI